MRLGEVYFFESDQAVGYKTRDKFHLYIGEGDWKYQGHIFLFISKSGASGGYRITRPPYDFLPREFSFVSCNSICSYSDARLQTVAGYEGVISNSHLLELRSKIFSEGTMADDQIALVVKYLNRIQA